MQGERFVGGLGCAEVLAKLDAFLDGSLPGPERECVVAHVAGCDRCERFGGTYAAVVRRIRDARGAGEPDPGVLDRLRERLDVTGS